MSDFKIQVGNDYQDEDNNLVSIESCVLVPTPCMTATLVLYRGRIKFDNRYGFYCEDGYAVPGYDHKGLHRPHHLVGTVEQNEGR